MKKEPLNIRLVDLEGNVAGMLIRFEKLETKVAELSTSNNTHITKFPNLDEVLAELEVRRGRTIYDVEKPLVIAMFDIFNSWKLRNV